MDRKYCYECDSYKGYYTKGRNGFFCASMGYCYTKREIVKQMDSCKQFCQKKLIPLEIRKKDAYAAIIRAVSLLEAVKQILDDDKDFWKRNK